MFIFCSGDLLGQSLHGLGSLLKMPYGCGEQNMLSFAPDVYILKYLQSTGQSAAAVTNEALGFINSGWCFTLYKNVRDVSYVKI